MINNHYKYEMLAEYTTPYMHMSGRKMTVSELEQWKKENPGVEPARGLSRLSTNETNTLSAPSYFIPPDIRINTTERINKAFTEIKLFSKPVKPLTKKKVNGGPNEMTLVKNEQLNFSPGIVFSNSYARIQGLKQKFPEYSDFVNAVLKRSAELYYGGGTLNGLVARLKEGLQPFPPGLYSTIPITKDEYDYVKLRLPFNPSNSVDFVDQTPYGLNPELNVEAHPGAPWFGKEEKVLNRLIEMKDQAQEYYQYIAKNGFAKFVEFLNSESNFDKSIVILKNKREIMERKNYLTKVRPYYVFPGGIRYLVTPMSKAINSALTSFEEDDESISAFGFTWTKDGAKRLRKWVTTRKNKRTGLHILSWGDDQYWVFVLLDNTCWLLNPDIKHMDMAIRYSTRIMAGRLAKDGLKSKIDNVWANIINFMCVYSGTHPLLAEGSLIVGKLDGLSSGWNATTYFDFVASARLGYRAELFFKDCLNINDLQNRISQFQIKINDPNDSLFMGMTLRLEDPLEQIYEQTLDINAKFLGSGIQTIKNFYGNEIVIPQPNYVDLIASLNYPDVAKNDKNKMGKLACRALGICVSGAWSHEFSYMACEAEYYSCIRDVEQFDSLWVKQAIGSELEGNVQEDEILKFLKDKIFPPVPWFANIYLNDKIPIINIRPEPSPSPNMLDIYSQFGIGYGGNVKKMTWADMTIEDEETFGKLEIRDSVPIAEQYEDEEVKIPVFHYDYVDPNTRTNIPPNYKNRERKLRLFKIKKQKYIAEKQRLQQKIKSFKNKKLKNNFNDFEYDLMTDDERSEIDENERQIAQLEHVEVLMEQYERENKDFAKLEGIDWDEMDYISDYQDSEIDDFDKYEEYDDRGVDIYNRF